jgi:hypothetical protein
MSGSDAVAGLRLEVPMTMRLTAGSYHAGQTTWWLIGQNRAVAGAGRTFGSMTEAGKAVPGCGGLSGAYQRRRPLGDG